MPHVMTCAQKLQPRACEMVEGDFGGIRGDPAELRTSGHVFSRHFGTSAQSQSQWGEDAALQTLAIAAHQRNEEDSQSQAVPSSVIGSSGRSMLSLPDPTNPVALGSDTGGHLEMLEWEQWMQAFDDFDYAVQQPLTT